MNALEVTQFHLDAWNRHDPDATATLYGEGETYHSPRMDHARTQVWKVIGLTLLVCGSLYGQQIISFDAPGVGTGFYQGTFPTSINPGGIIVGYYLDNNNVYHGFVRSRSGTFTVIDFPGASNTPNAYPTEGTQAISINQGGTIVGYYTSRDQSPFGNFLYTAIHNFMRAPDGTMTNIDPPNLYRSNPTSPPAGGPIVINDLGEVAGNYTSSKDFGTHGFLVPPSGNPVSFDAPSSYGTIPTGINSLGAITGFSMYPSQGFLRNPDGTFALPFGGPSNTFTTGINNQGKIIGSYQPCYQCYPPIGFVRTAAGVITNPFPGFNSYFPSANVYPYAINPAGTITGNYVPIDTYSGFVMSALGNFTSFDPAITCPSPTDNCTTATYPAAINPSGDITGYYNVVVFDIVAGVIVSDTNHGFLRMH